ncbi:MAG TPA: hypothetical protein VJT80_16195 [Steroidobacteraceae bacterium]|nr:hypothetical protein [Steroidobacteraceae bacterium]
MPIKELIVKSALDVAVDLVKRAFQNVQTFVVPEPPDTDSATVQLTIGSIPRRFRSPDGSADPLYRQVTR